MKMWDSIVIIADKADLEFAIAFRPVLELFYLRLHLQYCPTEETMNQALLGELPPADHVILCSSLLPDTPEEVLQKVRLTDRLVIMYRHPEHFEEMTKAWLRAGCRAVIRPTDELDQDAAIMFVLAFYYYLLDYSRPDRGHPISEREAFSRASMFDLEREGTGAFRMVERES